MLENIGTQTIRVLYIDTGRPVAGQKYTSPRFRIAGCQPIALRLFHDQYKIMRLKHGAGDLAATVLSEVKLFTLGNRDRGVWHAATFNRAHAG